MSFLSLFFRPRADGRSEPTFSDAARKLNAAKKNKPDERRHYRDHHNAMSAKLGRAPIDWRDA